jgi:hypothetical protein
MVLEETAMHASYPKGELIKRYPDMDPEYADFLVTLYNDVQQRIIDFRMQKVSKLNNKGVWQSDLALAAGAARLRSLGKELLQEHFGASARPVRRQRQ